MQPHDVALLALGRLGFDEDVSRELALALVNGLRDVIAERYGLKEPRLEVNAAQQTEVPNGFPKRTLLPHPLCRWRAARRGL